MGNRMRDYESLRKISHGKFTYAKFAQLKELLSKLFDNALYLSPHQLFQYKVVVEYDLLYREYLIKRFDP